MPKAHNPLGFCTFQGLQTAIGHCTTSIYNHNILKLLRETVSCSVVPSDVFINDTKNVCDFKMWL